MKSFVGAALLGAAAASEGAKLKLSWTDCGDSSTHGHIKSVTPDELTIGSKTMIAGKGSLNEAMQDVTYTVDAKVGWIKLFSHTGDACRPSTISLPEGLGEIDMKGFKCPISPGDAELDLDVSLSSNVPARLARLTIDLTAKSSTGDKAICMRIKTAPEGEEVAEDYPTPDGKTMINDENLIEWYNSANGATWVAGHNDFFNGMTFDDARPILGTALSHVSEHLNSTLSDSVYAALGDAPAEFDARTKWSGLIHPIRNQLHCGSCWAFSASEVMSDRVAIANGKASPVLSAEDLVSCDKNDFGCRGGYLNKAWDFIKNDGLVTDTCFPYTAGGGHAPACRTTCVDSEAFTRTRAVSAYAINGLTNMQKEMSTNGPIQVAFKVYRSFMSYKSGVYQKHFWEFQPEGGHAVKMIGWGSESGTDYWLVANSWGTTQWGEGGFFKIKRGANECGIESMGPPYAGMPAKSVVVV